LKNLAFSWDLSHTITWGCWADISNSSEVIGESFLKTSAQKYIYRGCGGSIFTGGGSVWENCICTCKLWGIPCFIICKALFVEWRIIICT
jgi:hypothetical protein